MKLSLIVPCYNEENNIEAFYNKVKTTFRECGFSYELIFVDDGSKDGTIKELKKIYRNDPAIEIISFSRNFGKEAAMLAGLKHSKGDLSTIIDADLQQQPEVVLQMVGFLDTHPEYDCIAAYQKDRSESKVISLLKGFFYKIINRVSDIKFFPGASDFRTFRRNMVIAIADMPEYFRFSKGIFSWVGFNTHYMPYKADERNAGTSKWSVLKLIKYSIEGLVSFTTFPLKIASFLGATFSFLAVLYLIVVIIQKLIMGISIPGYPTLIVLILLVGGIQLIILGIMGEYLARMYIQGKNRPIYIEKEVLPCREEKSK